ncbi:MAG: ABC transporter ATP-binding protein [Planctomycetes bacterium]|nr:ABC transporter ATP-binding protein [Planctomycetota bacterium]
MIRVERVTKRFGSTLAVDDVSFVVNPGEVVGFLGPNGAGKTTVLKMISTWLPPDAGKIEVAGFDVERSPLAVRRNLGYLPEHNALYEGMRVDRLLAFLARARGLEGARLRDRLAWAVERCALEAVLGKRVHQCSKGYRQRIGVAASLVHDPPVLVLDEPTHGLDPVQVVAFRDFLRGLRPGRAILFSSHILSEVAAISDRILVIHLGRLLEDSPVAALEAKARAAGRDLEGHVLEIVKAKGAAA